MIDGLEPFPRYKDSELGWLDDIPEHWQLRRAKWLFRKMDRPVREIDEVVTCFRDGVVTLRKNRRTSGFTESLKEIGYQGIRKGDLVIHAMDAFAGAVGVSDSDGKGTPVYAVCEPRPGADSRYYAFVVREMARSQWIAALATGIRERSTDFRFDDFASQQVPLPPVSEQASIVRFASYADRRLARAIRAKQALISLLNEQKQTIMLEAVTRGVDSSAKFSDSGSKWFPRVPEHWDVLPMRRVILKAIDGPHHSPEYIDEGIPFLSARNIKVDRWSLDDVKFISEASYQQFSRRVKPEVGDVLYTKGGTTGVARAVDLNFPFQVWVHVAVLKLDRKRISPHYLAMALNTTRCYEQAQILTRGATNQDLGLGRMKDIVLPVPPLAEQEEICRHAESATADLRIAIASATREIVLVREYRTRLISDLVTGKLDARDAAARLPNEADEADAPVAFDDSDSLVDEEIEADLDEADEIAEESLA